MAPAATFRRFTPSERVEAFVQACECDSRGRLGLENRPYPQASYMYQVIEIVRSIKAQDLPPEIQGPDIEKC